MSIRTIGFINSNFCVVGSPISEATKRKLIALGIDPSTVHSESEARSLIEGILALRKNANIPVPFGDEKTKISEIKNVNQTNTNSENMISLLEYDSSLKRIILGL